MKIDEVEIIYSCTANEYDTYVKQIEDKNRIIDEHNRLIRKKNAILSTIGFIICFAIIILIPAISIYWAIEKKVSETIGLLGLSIGLIGSLLLAWLFDCLESYFEDRLEEREDIEYGMELSYYLQSRKILSLDTKVLLLKTENDRHEVESRNLSKQRFAIIERTDLKDKAIIDLKEYKVFIPV